MKNRYTWIAAMVVAVASFLAAPGPAQAVSGSFSCRASGVRVASPLVNAEPIVSNKADVPCADDNDSLAKVAVAPLVATGLVLTGTDASPGGAQGGKADALVNGTTVTVAGVLVVKAAVVESHAVVSCGRSGPVLSGSSRIAGLSINGKAISVINQPVTIPIGAVLTVKINEQALSNGRLTQRAIHISSKLLGIDVVIAEATADAAGSPCGPVRLPQCSDAADNDFDGVADALDPGCHTDGNVNNPATYDPNDDDESDQPKPQCSDQADNDGDYAVDARDPGCHTDGNYRNPDSYDPNDDDETDPGMGS